MNDVFVLAGASVDTEVLDLFEIVLDILKETRRRGEGLIRGRDLWSQVSEKDARLLRLVVPPQNNVEAAQTANAVVSVKKVMSFISAVGDSLQEMLSYLASVRSPGWGLLSLPDEILGTIIELAAPAMEIRTGLGALHLSHVCRRFRGIALHLPGIWTYLSNGCHKFHIARLYAERSNYAGLEVETKYSFDSFEESDVDPEECCPFLQAVVPYCDEWRSCSYSGHHSNLPELHSALKLSRLEHLRVHSDHNRVYKLFDMPKLKSALLIDSIPPQPISSTITRFSVTFSSRYNGNGLESYLVPLLAFLKATPSITELGCGLTCYMDSSNASTSNIQCVTLENVEVFTLNVVYCSEQMEDDAARLLANSIRMPNMSKMDMNVRFTSATPPTSRKDPYIFGLLPNPAIHSNLRSLRLTTHEERAYVQEYLKIRGYSVPEYLDHNGTLVFDAGEAPFLTSLTLKTNFELRLSFDGTKFSPLCRLELDRCPRLTNEFMEDVYLGLKHGGNWEHFEEIVVRDCSGISADAGSLDRLIVEKTRTVPKTGTDSLAYEGFSEEKFWRIPQN